MHSKDRTRFLETVRQALYRTITQPLNQFLEAASSSAQPRRGHRNLNLLVHVFLRHSPLGLWSLAVLRTPALCSLLMLIDLALKR